MPTILMSLDPGERAAFSEPVAQACRETGLAVSIADAKTDPALIDYLVFTPAGPIQDFSRYPNLRAALSLWAGVERIVGNKTLTVPLCRMVDPGLTEGMTEYVTAHVLALHTGLRRNLVCQNGVWEGDRVPPLARHRTVGILGLGALGRACATSLVSLNFRVLGWSRRPAELPGVNCYSGPHGLDQVLSETEILITLLPSTPATTDLLNAVNIAKLPAGASIINPGRGSLIDEDALLAALDSGHLSHAVLDVFRTEPLPAAHPFWSHPGITVTPHIAATTRPGTASGVIAENIRRAEAGEPLLHLVDRQAGY